MEQRQIGDTDLVVSAVGFGTWEMSTTAYGEIDVDDADQSLNCYAQKEGESEVMLAENFGFRRETFGEGLNSISIWISGSLVDAKCIIDNIRISGPLDVGNWALY